jgi:prolyl-tRNA synthetase
MKDMYSFDSNSESALETYNEVRKAYDSFFTELGAPFIVAEADSGNMGGNLSHEYHYESPLGEDTVWSCSNCTYVANDEVIIRKSKDPQSDNISNRQNARVWRGLSIDRTTNVTFVYPGTDSENTEGSLASLNSTVLKEIFPQIDLTIKSLSPRAQDMIHQVIIKHPQVPDSTLQRLIDSNLVPGDALQLPTEKDFLQNKDGDVCPSCETGLLRSHRTIEVGHTFFLGSRYSAPFRLSTFDPISAKGRKVLPTPVQMGCYGIGVTRLVGALAEIGTQEINFSRSTIYGLNWPPSVAPYEVAIIYNKDIHFKEAQHIYDGLCQPVHDNAQAPDIVLDDRPRGIAWKLTDADMRGYPVLVILGNKMPHYVEIQCKSLGLKTFVSPSDLNNSIYSVLMSLKSNYLNPENRGKTLKTLQFGPNNEQLWKSETEWSKPFSESSGSDQKSTGLNRLEQVAKETKKQ